MKKETQLFYALVLAGALLFGVFGLNVIREAYLHEIQTVQNLAGRMFMEYPETKSDFLEALADMDRADSGAGSAWLERYGYDEEKKWKRTGVISIRFGFSGGIWRFLS